MIEELERRGFKVVGEPYLVRLPTYVNVSKSTKKAVNLNIYRNLHYHHLNTQKQNFEEEAMKLLAHVPRAELIAIHYTINASRNGRLDTMNVGSIVDKYFSDTLVAAGKIPDDDYKHVVFNSFSFGGVNPLDGYATAEIYILERNMPMRVLLDQNDIEDALNIWVENAGFPGANGVELTVEGGKVTAEVTFADGEDNEDDVEEEETSTPKKKGRGGRPRGSKNKPKPVEKQEIADVVGSTETGSDDSDRGGSKTSEASSESEPAQAKGKANPFAEPGEESVGSDDDTGTKEATKEEADPVAPVKKKSSIFDDE